MYLLLLKCSIKQNRPWNDQTLSLKKIVKPFLFRPPVLISIRLGITREGSNTKFRNFSRTKFSLKDKKPYHLEPGTEPHGAACQIAYQVGKMIGYFFRLWIALNSDKTFAFCWLRKRSCSSWNLVQCSKKKVMRGFEPGTSRSRVKLANHSAPTHTSEFLCPFYV